MKKRGWKKISVMCMVLSLALSTTAFAAGITVENVDQTEIETEEKTEDNGLESRFFVMETETETEEMEAVYNETEIEKKKTERIRNVTLEELESKESVLESEEEVKEKPQIVLAVIQKKNFWNQEEMQETEPVEEEIQSVEKVLNLVQETETIEETESDIEKEEEEDVPVITLTKEQEEEIRKAASLAKEMIVMVNGGTLEDELMFQDQKNVKAVLVINEKTEESFKEEVEDLKLEKVYAEYQKKIEEKSAKKEKKAERKKTIEIETEKKQVESVLPGTTLAKAGDLPTSILKKQTPSAADTEKITEIPVISINKTSGSTESTTDAKEIKIDMVPETLEEEDDELYVAYKISCPDDVKITEASFKITYDSTKMSYDTDFSTEGEDINTDDFDFTATDHAGSVTLNIKAKSGKTQVMKGTVLDLGFALKQEAKLGDVYNLKIEVTSMKASGTVISGSGNNEYKITVNEQSVKTMAYSDEDSDDGDGTEQTESQPQSQSQPQPQTETQTQSQTQSLQKAAKTDDITDTTLWITLLAVSAVLFGSVMFRKKTL